MAFQRIICSAHGSLLPFDDGIDARASSTVTEEGIFSAPMHTAEADNGTLDFVSDLRICRPRHIVQWHARFQRCGMDMPRYAQAEVLQTLVPNSPLPLNKCAYPGSRVYGGHFGADGKLFFTACQDAKIRLYDSTNPNKFKLLKEVVATEMHWTITDTAISPDNQFFAYTTIAPYVAICNTRGERVFHELHNMDTQWDGGIWSVRFSANGTKLIAGASDGYFYIYDIERKKTLVKGKGHEDDVNTVELLGSSVGLLDNNVFVTGSDDNLIKIWDLRCMPEEALKDSNDTEEAPQRRWRFGMRRRSSLAPPVKSAKVLVGHTQGLTCVRARPFNSFYLCSNAKDQLLKVWDIRKCGNEDKCNTRAAPSWDYRWQQYPVNPALARHRHSHDQSVHTFLGHSILKTLIRCNFSPASTGSRYVYSGSADGRVYIWDLTTGERVQKLHHSRPGERNPVRDVSWHPYYPCMTSAAWDGRVLLWKHVDKAEHKRQLAIKEDKRKATKLERDRRPRGRLRGSHGHLAALLRRLQRSGNGELDSEEDDSDNTRRGGDEEKWDHIDLDGRGSHWYVPDLDDDDRSSDSDYVPSASAQRAAEQQEEEEEEDDNEEEDKDDDEDGGRVVDETDEGWDDAAPARGRRQSDPLDDMLQAAFGTLNDVLGAFEDEDKHTEDSEEEARESQMMCAAEKQGEGACSNERRSED
ncbi:unnamed protein product [Vitrella brassicaformis CCMP3155]|uniref:Anaphase-promoting complex subunit 4 WD40 domain-containing protein n=2 Tax=Vitrella brassicaformis TaxID=1169539 RepID=A0A0G4F6R8_VITBC|nr:unnamed protein product [Vitrella brassicaformis CCMP3155]|eukprot:CEM08131.1 unnamed protein product [Vitrella brassicaformis CCMP3155]